MLGMLNWQARGGVRLEETRVAGLRVLCAHVGHGRGEGRRLARAGKLLRRAGVGRVLPGRAQEPGVPGLPSVDAAPLFRAVADRLTLELLKRRDVLPEQATVILRGDYPDGELTAAARALCPRVRQVVVDTERGGQALQRRLLLDYGVAVGPVTDRRTVLEIRFSGRDRGEHLVLCGGIKTQGLTADMTRLALPETLERTGVLCALWRAGLLELSQLEIVDIPKGNKFT